MHLASGAKQTELDLSSLKKPLNVRVYQEKEIGVSIGDRLRWTQNNHKLGRINGQEFTAMGIEDGLIRVRYDDGKRDQIALSQHNHIDHGLVRTIYSSQGMTCDRVIVAMGNDQGVTREAILVAMSRARHEAQFFCANKSVLYERVQHSGAQINIADWLMEQGFKMDVPSVPEHIDLVAELQQSIQQHHASEYKRLSKLVLQQQTGNPSQRKIDIAIAAVCLSEGLEIAPILAHSPAITIKKALTEKAKAYIESVSRDTVKLQKTMQQKQTLKQTVKPAMKL